MTQFIDLKKKITINIGIFFLFMLAGCTCLEDKSPQNGNVISYYKNGNIKSSINYKKGEMDSIAMWYYKNGILEIKGNYVNDKKFGDFYFYSKKGVINGYNFYDFSGNLVYRRDYDKTGELILEKGKPVLIYFPTPKDTFSIGEDIEFIPYIARPANTEINALIGCIASENDEFVNEITFKVSHKTPLIQYPLDSANIERIYLIAEFKDSTNKAISRDTTYININIRG